MRLPAATMGAAQLGLRALRPQRLGKEGLSGYFRDTRPKGAESGMVAEQTGSEFCAGLLGAHVQSGACTASGHSCSLPVLLRH